MRFFVTSNLFYFSSLAIGEVYANENNKQPQRQCMEETKIHKGILVADCSQLEKKPRPIYNATTWKLLQDEYFRVKPDEVFWKEDADRPLSGFKVPFEVRQMKDDKGRGVFATKPIFRGEIVWDHHYYAEFENETIWTEFVSHIASFNYELACDILQWAYVDEDTDSHYVAIDLDEGSMVNHREVGNNLGLPPEIEEEYFGEYALRDIEVGEELTVDYTSFYKFGKLLWFENQVKEAWSGKKQDSLFAEKNKRWDYR